MLGGIALVPVPDLADIDRVLQDRAQMTDAERSVAPVAVAGRDKWPCRDALPIKLRLEVADTFEDKEAIKYLPDDGGFRFDDGKRPSFSGISHRDKATHPH